MERKEILEQAIKAVCTDRDGQYGSPENNFKVIAEFWTDYLRNSRTLKCGSISAKDVAVMMTLFKIARITTGKHKDDNFVDLAGYAACAAELGPVNLFDVEADGEIEELRTENEKLREDNEELSIRISAVQDCCMSWKKDCDSLKKELLSEREVKGKLLGEIKQLRADRDFWVDKCKELGGITGDVDRTEQLNQEADNSATEVEEELETEEAFCENDLQEIEKLKSEKKLLKYEDKIKTLGSQIKSLEYRNSQLFKKWAIGNDTIKRMSEELKQERDKCVNLNETLEGANITFKNMCKELEQKRDKCDNLKRNIEERNERLVEAYDEIDKREKIENSLRKENEELKQEKEFSKIYKSELEHSKEDMKMLKDRIHTLYNERDYLKGENEYLKAEKERLLQAVLAVEAKK